jgi:hypothetical protein
MRADGTAQKGRPLGERPTPEAARAQVRKLLAAAREASNRRTKRKLHLRAFEFAQMAAVVEEDGMTRPPHPVIWPRHPAQRRGH